MEAGIIYVSFAENAELYLDSGTRIFSVHPRQISMDSVVKHLTGLKLLPA
jgi:hypothetical protein